MSGREVIKERKESKIRAVCYQASYSSLRKHKQHDVTTVLVTNITRDAVQNHCLDQSSRGI